MIVYWIMLLLPVVGAALFMQSPLQQQRLFLLVITFFYILIVGFRYEVGCDWFAYQHHFDEALITTDWADWEFVSTDVGYALVNLLVASTGSSVVGVNFVCAVIALSGLYQFSRQQPIPFLAYVAAVPYLVIVLFQGYTRQATAFGFEMFALVALSQANNRKFVFYIFLAATFHKTAIILLPLAALSSTKNKWWSYLWIGVTSVAAFVFFLAEKQESLWQNYVVADMASSGGGIRVALNVLPSVIFLLFKNRFLFETENEKKLWFWISILSLICIPLVGISSTAVDRIALYLMPIQLYVFSRLPLVFPQLKNLVILAVVLLYFSVQFVWLNFATHAFCWIPYHSWLFQ